MVSLLWHFIIILNVTFVSIIIIITLMIIIIINNNIIIIIRDP